MKAGEDWTKFVTLNPPNEVRFKFEDKEAKTEESQIDVDSSKAVARVEIINRSNSTIMFKVSTRVTLTNHRSKQQPSTTTWSAPMPKSFPATTRRLSRSSPSSLSHL